MHWISNVVRFFKRFVQSTACKGILVVSLSLANLACVPAKCCARVLVKFVVPDTLRWKGGQLYIQSLNQERKYLLANRVFMSSFDSGI